ncbi:hypothetical protein DYB37_009877 [Aphanomyces astaci]|uniref:Uncharacterized protein n=1 Tax=Aphanomyces astaci TaxID=112090 RepID=A0A418FT51_APHAT|nr:hypothetical protein DYB37_009877 [Aphanomyces astaci]
MGAISALPLKPQFKMSWFGKPTSKPAPAANTSAVSELQRLRGRQISSLVRAGGQAINHQQSIFDVVVRLVDSRTLTLRMYDGADGIMRMDPSRIASHV